MEGPSSYNARLCLEERLRFQDSQTGVAKNHTNMSVQHRVRSKGDGPGRPTKQCKKKKRTVPIGVEKAVVEGTEIEAIDATSYMHNINAVENPAGMEGPPQPETKDLSVNSDSTYVEQTYIKKRKKAKKRVEKKSSEGIGRRSGRGQGLGEVDEVENPYGSNPNKMDHIGYGDEERLEIAELIKLFPGQGALDNSWTASQDSDSDSDSVSGHFLSSPSDMVEKDLKKFSENIKKICKVSTINTEHVKHIAQALFSYYVRKTKSKEFQKVKSYYFSEKVRILVQFLVKRTHGNADALRGIVSSLPPTGSVQWKGFRVSDRNVFQSNSLSDTRPILGQRTAARVEPFFRGTPSSVQGSTDLSPDYAALLLRWFMDDQGQCIIKQPGGLLPLFKCLWHSDEQGCLDLDVRMLPIVKNLLSLETKESLHSPSGSVLYYSAMLELPQVTRELLSHQDISLNDEKLNGLSLISNLIQKLDSVHDKSELGNIAAIVNLLLEHPSMTAETVISCGKALLQLVSDTYSRDTRPMLGILECPPSWQNTPLKVEKMLVTLQLLHDTVTRCFFEKSQWRLLRCGALLKFIALGQTNSDFLKLHPDIMEGEFKTKYQNLFVSMVGKLNFSVNKCKFEGDPEVFGFGSKLIASMNPTLLDAIVKSPKFDPVFQNPKGETVFHFLANTLMATDRDTLDRHYKQFSAMLYSILKHPQMDTSVTNTHGLTAFDIVCQVPIPDSCLIHLFVTELGKHPTATGAMIHKTICHYTRLPQEEQNRSIKPQRYTDGIVAGTNSSGVSTSIRTKKHDKFSHPYKRKVQTKSPVENGYQKWVANLCCHKNFDINQKNDDGFTVGLVAAQNGNAKALEVIIQTKGFNPSATDPEGNTALFYIFEKFSLGNVTMLLKKCSWDFSSQNELRESVYEYCDNVETFAPQKRLLGLCRKLMPQQKTGLAIPCSEPQQTPVEREPRPVSLNLLASDTRQASVVKPTEQNIVDLIHGYPQKVYDLKKARKGKALILNNHTFDVPWLKRLEGYTYDQDQLRVLWDHMGFEVLFPTCEGTDSVLTAQEMESAVAKFSEELTEADDCAVLCVLSHGGDGFVYGSDGKPVKIYSLLKHLDNQHCQAMIGKPKVVIIQACNGSKSDSGLCQTAGQGLAEAAASVDKTPLLSDMVICSPSMPGYVSYVYKTPGQGSVFIKTLIEMLQKYAATEDFYAIHTRVNERISGEIITVENPDHTVGEYKQMCHFDSCLLRHLYFMPCPGGKQGADWN